MILSGANNVYVQRQLGHSSIQLTVDTYTHWLKESERGQTLEVDRLGIPFSEAVGTFPGTLTGGRGQAVDLKREKWGEWVNDFRTFVRENPESSWFLGLVA
jgi:hypothetical protein